MEDNVFPIAKVDTLTPEKMVETIAADEPGTTLDNVSHVLLHIDVISGKPTWSVYLKSGSYYEAAFDGTNVHKGGQGTTPSPATGSGSTSVGGQ